MFKDYFLTNFVVVKTMGRILLINFTDPDQ